MDIWIFMKNEIEECKQALVEEPSFQKEEANEELWYTLIQKLNEISFSLIYKDDQTFYDGINGSGKNLSITDAWNILRRNPSVNRLLLMYQEHSIELPDDQTIYERLNDFIRYVADSLKIPYQV